MPHDQRASCPDRLPLPMQCNLGPVLVVYPAGVWYGGLDEASISQIVTQHFIDGEVVEAHARLVPAPDTTRSPA